MCSAAAGDGSGSEAATGTGTVQQRVSNRKRPGPRARRPESSARVREPLQDGPEMASVQTGACPSHWRWIAPEMVSRAWSSSSRANGTVTTRKPLASQTAATAGSSGSGFVRKSASARLISASELVTTHQAASRPFSTDRATGLIFRSDGAAARAGSAGPAGGSDGFAPHALIAAITPAITKRFKRAVRRAVSLIDVIVRTIITRPSGCKPDRPRQIDDKRGSDVYAAVQRSTPYPSSFIPGGILLVGDGVVQSGVGVGIDRGRIDRRDRAALDLPRLRNDGARDARGDT